MGEVRADDRIGHAGIIDSLSGLMRRAGYLTRAYARPLTRWRVPVATVAGLGAGSGEPRTLLVAGWKRTVAYYAQRYFSEYDEPVVKANVPVLALATVLNRARSDADLIIARVPAPGSSRLFGESYYRVPEAVEARLEIPADPEELVAASTRARRNISRVREHELSWSISTDATDFNLFYEQYYVPFLRVRYDDLAHEIDRRTLRRALRRGCLLWVWYQNRRVAGALLQARGRLLRWLVMGAVADGVDLAGIGALSAIYVFSVECAIRHGFRSLDLGYSKASPRDGVLSHKASWGARVYCPWRVDHNLMFAWDRFDDDIARFLSTTPLIFRKKSGLGVVTAMTDDDGNRLPVTIGKKVAMPGLTDVIVMGKNLGSCSSPIQHSESLIHLIPGRSSGAFEFRERSFSV